MRGHYLELLRARALNARSSISRGRTLRTVPTSCARAVDARARELFKKARADRSASEAAIVTCLASVVMRNVVPTDRVVLQDVAHVVGRSLMWK